VKKPLIVNKNNSIMSEKKSSALDKVIMGAIIGTAIGSAIGVSMAPKKGSETRQVIKDKAREVSSDAQEVGILAAETASGFFKLAKRILFGRSKAKIKAKNLKEIPHEDSLMPEKHVE
jgi:gas vesicle protein